MRSLGVLLIAALALARINAQVTTDVSGRGAVADLLTETNPPAGFEYAIRPRDFEFPADHGAHPRFRSEWWYFTGNTDSPDGSAFGFQLTIFRFALSPRQIASHSPWRRPNVYMGHFAVSDINQGLFHNFERQGRPALDLAGAGGEPTRIWIRDWSIELVDAENETWHIAARESGVALDLVLRAERPVTPQGDRGLSKKNDEPGNASYYYSIPRLAAAGTIETAAGLHQVSGTAWFDHEWSTSALAEGQLGWDWFSLQLDDGSDLMFYQIRNAAGQSDTASHGLLLSADGQRTALQPAEIHVTVRKYWRSPTSGARYPSGWQIRIPARDLELSVTPRLQDQEWRKNFTYWEGAVGVTGVAGGTVVSGRGYVELVGYE